RLRRQSSRFVRRAAGLLLFPYTTLFRSGRLVDRLVVVRQDRRCHRGEEVRLDELVVAVHGSRQFHDGAYLRRLRLGTVLQVPERDRKSTRLNSSHVKISYAVFCLKKKTR